MKMLQSVLNYRSRGRRDRDADQNDAVQVDKDGIPIVERTGGSFVRAKPENGQGQTTLHALVRTPVGTTFSDVITLESLAWTSVVSIVSQHEHVSRARSWFVSLCTHVHCNSLVTRTELPT